MATSLSFLNIVLKATVELDISYKKMMGEYLLYLDGVLFGGLYDDRLLLKPVGENAKFNLKGELPYDGAKPMLKIDCLDNPEKVQKIIVETVKGLKK